MDEVKQDWLVFGDSHVNAFARAKNTAEELWGHRLAVNNFAPGRLARRIVGLDGELNDTLTLSPVFASLVRNNFDGSLFCFGSNEALRYQFSAWTKEVAVQPSWKGSISEEMLNCFFESAAVDVLKAIDILQDRYGVETLKFLWCPPPMENPRRIAAKMKASKRKTVSVAASAEKRWKIWSIMVSVFEKTLPKELMCPDSLRHHWLPEEMSLDGVHGNEKWALHCLSLVFDERLE